MKCCICGENFEEWENDAYPLMYGKCSDECNQNKVIPARMKLIERKEQEE